MVDQTECMIKRVPFEVFEVNLSGSTMPGSVETFLQQGVIIDAAMFLTGAGAFNKDKVSLLFLTRPTISPLLHLFFGAERTMCDKDILPNTTTLDQKTLS